MMRKFLLESAIVLLAFACSCLFVRSRLLVSVRKDSRRKAGVASDGGLF